MKRILLLGCVISLFLANEAIAQERQISGRVTSGEDGSTNPGVNVVLKGTNLGTITDVDGNYRINVPQSGGALIFSFVGFQSKEVQIGNQTIIDVRLDVDITQLSEIIVTGYGVQEKRTLTGAVASVKGSTFDNLPMQSADRAIQGRAAGVQVAAASGQPGGALNIRVRGVGSINASNDPLWIIDGVQMARFGGTSQGSQNPLASINPNDIESIDILKDAAASAIYGAQAANGVVIVTTKKGKKGKSSFDITAQYGVVKPVNLYEMTDAVEFAKLKEVSYVNAGLPLTGATGAHTIFGDPNNPSSITPFDWVNGVFRDSNLGTYDLSMSGGDDKTTFLFSGSYQTQEGQVIHSDWKRGTGRLNLTHKLTDKLTVGANFSMSYERTFGTIANGNFVNGPFQAAFTAQPTSPAFASDGITYNPYPVQAPGSHLFGYNIIEGLDKEVRLGRTMSTVSSANISYEIIPGLTLNGFAGINAAFNRDNNQRPANIPVFAGSGGQGFVRNRRSINYNMNTTLNYAKKIADDHSISGLVGFEFKKETREIVDASQWGYSDPYFRLLSSGSTARPAAEFFNEYSREGVFGQVKYGFQEKYLADFTLRRDGSSRFGTSSRYGTFYAGSIGWRITEESFMESIEFLNDLKLRASYGKVGNSDINDYDGLTSFGAGPAGHQYLGGPLLRPTRLGNDLITWEDEFQMTVGIDFAVLNSRIYGAVEYFSNSTQSLLFDVPLPVDSGFGTIRGNSGEVLNTGIEIELGGVPVNIGGFKWAASLNFSTLKNELVSLPNNQQRIGNTLIVGEPIQFFYLFDFAGINPANGKAMIYDTLGNLAYRGIQQDAAVRGTAIPKYYGGLSNTFSYKGISLEVFFQFQGGNQAFNGDLYNLYAAGSSANNQLRSQLNYWSAPGDVTNVPMPRQGGTIDGNQQQFSNFGSTQFMSDASYIRLKQVTLAYDIPSSILNKAKIAKANVFVQGINLWTYSKFLGMDPEVVNNNNANGASSFGVFPVSQQFTAGITIGL